MSEQIQSLHSAKLDSMASLMAALGALTVSDAEARLTKALSAEELTPGTEAGIDHGHYREDQAHADALFRLFIGQSGADGDGEIFNRMADACLRAAEYLKSGAHMNNFTYPPGVEQFSQVLEAPNARVVPHMIDALYQQNFLFRNAARGFDPTEQGRWEQLRK